jgi:K+-sensing histidine kinase KdpD
MPDKATYIIGYPQLVMAAVLQPTYKGADDKIDRSIEGFIQTNPALLCVIDSSDKIIKASNSFFKALGYSTSEFSVISTHELDYASSALSLTQTVASCRKHGVVNGSEIAIKKKDGTALVGIAFGSTWKDENEKIICGIAIIEESHFPDRSRDKEIISELRKRENLKDQFIAVASHELRTPIQPLLGLAVLAKRGKINQEEAWDKVLKESRRLQQLANDILDVSRIESESITYNMEKIRLAEIVEHVAGVQKYLETDEVSLKLEVDEEARTAVCEVDRARITQAIMNIVGNAMKFTKKGEVLIRAKVDGSRGIFDVIIKDSAGGIPESVMSALFGRFVTAKVGEDESHGSGLGLYIANSVVSAHKGIIYVCNCDSGATFVVRLPLCHSA